MQGIWHAFKQVLAPIEEPQIRETIDRHGKTQWQVYDPDSDRTLRFNSPQEVSTWLEERRSASATFF